MALTTESYTGNGSQKEFQVASTILSESHVRAHLNDGSGDTLVSSELWDLLGSTILFETAPADGVAVKITVSSDGEGLDDAPTSISAVAANINTVVTVGDSIASVNALAAIIAKINSLYGIQVKLESLYTDKVTLDSLYADKAILDSIFADKTKLDSIYADKTKLDSLYADKAQFDALYLNLAEVLQADDNASIATAQAGIATTKAGEASGFRDEAETFKNQSSTNATTAANHLASIEAIYDNFDDRYLGAFASDPTLDNDGNALQIGAIYFNTTVNNTKFYNGSTWEDPEATATQAASQAQASATAASTSEANAGTSETNAGNSASQAAQSLSDLNEKYVVSATAPVTPVEGGLWFDTVADKMKVYNGSSWELAGSSVNGTSERTTATATEGQTTFNVTYDVGFVDVFVNGIKLFAPQDFTATTGTTVVMTSGLTAGDLVDIIAFGTFNVANTYTQTTTDALLDAKLDHNDTIYTSGGNVGIGTSSPNTKLHQKGGVIRSEHASDGRYTDIGHAALQFNGGSGDRYIDNIANTDLSFRFGSGYTERLRILPTGGITFNGDISTANALDDYEEGTWTPTIGGYSGTTYTFNQGNYTKIGNVVTAHFNMTISSIGTYTGNTHIIGLPFSAGPTNTPSISMQFSMMTALNETRDEHYGAIYNGGSTLFIYTKTGTPKNGDQHKAGTYAGTITYISY